jgi:hypothetical protein
MSERLTCALFVVLLLLTAPILAKNFYFPKGENGMGVMAIIAYRPRAGKAQELLDLTRQHQPALRRAGLATDRPPYAMRAKDGTIVEVFEWKSKEAIASAHQHPAVLEMWKRYEAACEYIPLANLAECKELFAGFEPLPLH